MENPPPYSPDPQAPSYPPQVHPGYPAGQQPPGYPQAPPPDFQQAPPGYPQAPPPDFQQAPPGYPQQHAGGYPQQPVGGYPQQPAGGYAPAGYPPPSYSSTTNTTAVVAQRGFVQAAVRPYLNDYLGLSICSFFCCWFIAIIAIMKSLEARNRYAAGDNTGALVSASSARCLSIAAIVCGTCITAIIVISRVA